MSEEKIQEFGSRTSVHESPIYGRVLEIALIGSQSQEVSAQSRQVLEGEIDRHRPRYLVIDLRRFDSKFGMDLLGALVAGGVAMRKLGAERQTRILARGPTAEMLDRAIRLAKIDVLFAGRTYPDLESALASGGASPLW